MKPTEEDLRADIAAIGMIDAVPVILEVICRTTGMGFAAVARVTEDRWIACAVHDEIAFGLKPGGELKVETTICDEIRHAGKGVVIDEVATDQKYRGHPTPAMYGFQSYISIPIWRADKTFFGTLCAIDPRPAKVNRPEVIATFELFAQLIATNLEQYERHSANETALASERESADLREQFIAALGHDLRNPLASIDAGVRKLRATPIDQAPPVLNLIQKSVGRMTEMIDNVLDLARSRLGGGVVISVAEQPDLGQRLQQVIDELRSTAPTRVIESTLAIATPVVCDGWRIGRLLSNLLGNAIAYGDPDKPIRVTALTDATNFELAVSNQGDPISPAMSARIFQPFVRGSSENKTDGVGLGLYISSQIARAHGGVLEVESTPAETRFTFRMPLKPVG